MLNDETLSSIVWQINYAVNDSMNVPSFGTYTIKHASQATTMQTPHVVQVCRESRTAWQTNVTVTLQSKHSLRRPLTNCESVPHQIHVKRIVTHQRSVHVPVRD